MTTLFRLTTSCFWIALLLISGAFTPCHAEVRLPGFFTDHLVFQREAPVQVWGWANPSEAISVVLGDAKAQATADEDGRWRAELPAMPATKTGLTLRVSGSSTIELNDVLIGEVWLCSGQSNMEWTVARSSNAGEEIASANHPLIRHVKIPRRPSNDPLDNVEASWEVCSPETAGNFTAAGYFMARELMRTLDVPVGLINSSWGGTRIEPWTPPTGFAQTEALSGIYQSVIQRTPGTPEYQERLAKNMNDVEAWLTAARAGLENASRVQPSPKFPSELTPFQSHQDPTMLYNGMIHPLIPYTIRGSIWYQGESNHNEGKLYTEKKKALVSGWREVWDQGKFPFYYVQIAPFQYGNESPTILPEFWEAQAEALSIPETGMIVINDIATLNDIHPPNKQDVGMRLALLALRNEYGFDDLVANSPTMKSMEIENDRIVIQFKSTGGGLKTSDGQAPSHFELIGSQSNGFQTASATIDGDRVILSSERVRKPTAFRFAWDKIAVPNLTGGTGLPVGAFRGGELPDFFNSIPGGKDYQLVYELNLSKLAAEITYDIDRADQVSAFDRIGYLLELQDQDSELQQVFVTMDAFTENVRKIGVPTVASEARFQQKVTSMDIFCSTDAVASGRNLSGGNIEFWPNNYGPNNSAGIKGASGSIYDFGDDPSPPEAGYGSMQVHNHEARQTVFAINQWKAGVGADLGIGNSSGKTRDWTFSGNASSYTVKRLRVYVRPSL